MSGQRTELDLDAVVAIDKIPSEGRTVSIDTDAEQRELLAERLKVSQVNAFSAKLTASRFRGGIRAQGTVQGTIVQPCVVSGDPVVQHIDESVDRVFLPGRDEASESPAGAEVFVNLEDDDLPDYFEGNEIDLAETVLEVFALAIELYPRAPGVELAPEQAGDDPADISPFAALKALKKE